MKTAEDYILGIVYDGSLCREDLVELIKEFPLSLPEVERWMEGYAQYVRDTE